MVSGARGTPDGVYLTRDELAKYLDEAFVSGSEVALETVLDVTASLRGRLRTRHYVKALLDTVRAAEFPASRATQPPPPTEAVVAVRDERGVR